MEKNIDERDLYQIIKRFYFQVQEAQNIEYFEFYSITKKIMHDFGGNFSKYSKYVLMGENRYQNHTYTHQYLILTKIRSKVN